MNSEAPCAGEQGQTLDEVLAEFLLAVEAGQAPPRHELLARYPDLAQELESFFQGRDRFDRLVAPLRVLGLGRDSIWADFENGLALPCSFGDYELLEEMAHGGMGVVYRAHQKSAHRLVAVKRIRAGALASAGEVQRFRNEAEMVANLDHANIVPLYDVGEHDGQPYFSMKLVEGHSLAEQLERYRADPKAAARLLILVARAVHHAHQRGILHRDLKPSNVLLDTEGRPHVTDFGLARRAGGDNGLTQTGAIVGTPSYMAPEQAEGRRGAVTTATDVYGLGAVLYALLTGKPPFHGDSVLDTLEQVRGHEPESPSGSNNKVDRDLETVCLKCLDKDPARRYPSAEAVADDLDRWLRGEPILARSVSRLARLWRWRRRNPVVAGLTAAISLLVLLGIAGLALATLTIQYKQGETKEALAKAQANYVQAEAQRQRAENNFRQAFWALQDLMCAYDQRASLQPLSVGELRQWQTERALRFLAPFCEDASDEPAVRLQKGAAFVHRGRVYQVNGQRPKAQQEFRQAVAVFDRLVQEFPDDPTYLRELATALCIVAEDLYQAELVREANAFYTQGVSAWRDAVRKHPADVEACLQLTFTQCLWLDCDRRDPAAALVVARKAVELAPDNANAWMALGIASYRTGQWQASVVDLQNAFQKGKGQRAFDTTIANFFLAMAQWRCGKQEMARKAYQQAMQWMEHSYAARDVFTRAVGAEAAALLGVHEPPRPRVKEAAPRPD